MNGCSINFTSPGQPKITFLFNTLSCVNYIRIPTPSNVQQFSYSIYDENGFLLQPPDTLMSNMGDNPILQPDPNICAHTVNIQLLKTKNNDPPVQVNIDMGICFLNRSAITTASLPSQSPVNLFDTIKQEDKSQIHSC